MDAVAGLNTESEELAKAMTAPMPWTEAERAFVATNWPTMKASRIATALGRTKNMVIGMTTRLGLTKRDAQPTEPAMTEADFAGCRYPIGDHLPPHPGMFCCAPCVKETDPMTGELRTSSYCRDHWTLCHTAPQGKSRWTPERSRKHAALMRRKFLARSPE